ncbi:hypothetical protein F2Q68_00039940 [Brassica cretica]|uniref:Uncharacterized protein n=2 Tax=Brassica cretica TaxID=69181 RepID=A0ABQ7CJN5_BRACR|nr:hypothetical protein F2Q68_00039940 [Brassica cretica]KAF3551921.1 hypothetical protein DY000_02007685 [Brassica cretica]
MVYYSSSLFESRLNLNREETLFFEDSGPRGPVTNDMDAKESLDPGFRLGNHSDNLGMDPEITI